MTISCARSPARGARGHEDGACRHRDAGMVSGPSASPLVRPSCRAMCCWSSRRLRARRGRGPVTSTVPGRGSGSGAQISRRCSSATTSASTTGGPRRSPVGAPPASAQRGNIADLVDDGSFVEYAAHRRRATPSPRPRRRRARRPTVSSWAAGKVDGHSVIAMSYDYTVLAGTQGVEPPQEGPPLRPRRALAAPDRVLHRGGGGRPVTPMRPASRTSTSSPSTTSRTERARPARGDQQRLLLRRERGDPRLLRRDHRHRELEHRHGRSGDDRGRRLGVVRAHDHRSDRRAGRERRRRPRGRGRSRGRGGRQAVPVVLPGSGRRVVVRRPAARSDPACRSRAPRVRRPSRDRDPVRHRQQCSSSGERGARHGDVLACIVGSTTGSAGEQSGPPRRCDRRRRRRQGVAVPPALRRVRPPVVFLCDTPGFMVGPGTRACRRAPPQPHVRDRRT